jgi:hypothetical protein
MGAVELNGIAPGLLAIGQHGPQRVRFRNFVVR